MKILLHKIFYSKATNSENSCFYYSKYKWALALTQTIASDQNRVSFFIIIKYNDFNYFNKIKYRNPSVYVCVFCLEFIILIKTSFGSPFV